MMTVIKTNMIFLSKKILRIINKLSNILLLHTYFLFCLLLKDFNITYTYNITVIIKKTNEKKAI